LDLIVYLFYTDFLANLKIFSKEMENSETQ